MGQINVVDYKCDVCGEIKEINNDGSGDVPMHCGEPMRRCYSATGISFKGSGFYVNDYKNK